MRHDAVAAEAAWLLGQCHRINVHSREGISRQYIKAGLGNRSIKASKGAAAEARVDSA
jgi:hypothetical protein